MNCSTEFEQRVYAWNRIALHSCLKIYIINQYAVKFSILFCRISFSSIILWRFVINSTARHAYRTTNKVLNKRGGDHITERNDCGCLELCKLKSMMIIQFRFIKLNIIRKFQISRDKIVWYRNTFEVHFSGDAIFFFSSSN